MNSKKNKNKHRSNKPPNPNPPHKINPIVAEKVEDVHSEEKPETSQHFDERVPEIISDIVLPVLESEDKGDDTPRKPKRNRGKKKKQDQGEQDSQEEQPQECEDVKTEAVDVPQEITAEVPSVTPSARKKKNKNKKTAESDQKDVEKTEKSMVESSVEVKSDTIESNVKESEIITPCDNSSEQEAKHKKKNKKKKNRTDSERSEKAEDISCVASFQKLIKDEKNDAKNESDSNIKSCGEIEKVSIDIAPDTSVENIIQTSAKKQVEDNTEDLLIHTASDIDAKSKKKNKKDKKNSSKEEDVKKVEEITDSNKEIQCKSIEGPLFDISATIKEELTDPIIQSREAFIETALQTLIFEEFKSDEEIAKSKATIAKPVERKRKEKIQEQIEDSVIESMSNKENVQSKEKPQESELRDLQSTMKESIADNIKDLQQIIPDAVTSLEVSETKEEVEKRNIHTSDKLKGIEDMKKVINIPPPACEMGKKRKKSPKPAKPEHIAKSQLDSKSTLPDEPIKSEETEIVLPNLTETPVKKEIITSLKEIDPEEIRLEKNAEPPSSTESKIKDDNISESKIKKKRKKSPKLPVENEYIQKTKEVSHEEPKLPHKDRKINIAAEEITKRKNKCGGDDSKQKEEVSYSPKEDIEISSLKADESEGSTCGATPDIIQYPRAISQDPIDNNNNMTIVQEITVSEETKLQIPIEIPIAPLIQGSGETPMTTPEFIIIDNFPIGTKPRIDKPKEQEKTDLKSKMIEVNQDMEELRLSIERSLAELTAIEKCDVKVEKEYSDKTLHITEEKDIKTGMPSEIVAKLTIDTEKCDTMEKTDSKNQETMKGEKKSTEIIESFEKSAPKYERSEDVIGEIQTDHVSLETLLSSEPPKPIESVDSAVPPVCPERKDHKSKGKHKKKGKQEAGTFSQPESPSVTPSTEEAKQEKDIKKEEKTEPKSESTQEKGKQQSAGLTVEVKTEPKSGSTQEKGKQQSAGLTEEAKTEQKAGSTKEKGKQQSAGLTEDAKTEAKSGSTQEKGKQQSAGLTEEAKTEQKSGSTQEKGKQKLAGLTEEAKTEQKSGSTQEKGKQQSAGLTEEAKTKQKSGSTQEKGKQQSAGLTEKAKTEQKSGSTQEKGKKQSAGLIDDDDLIQTGQDFEPIESFEDALTSSADDINKTFEIIANEADHTMEASHVNPEINIIAPIEDKKQGKKDEKVNPVSQPKNLLGHPDIPAPSNRIDYKKEKNKSPNETLAKVKIKDAVQIDSKRESKESQTNNIQKFMKNKSIDESFALVTNENEEFVYKYSFRKVFLQSACHVCKKDLKQARIPCSYCNLVFYCNAKHKDEDWPQHQALCFAVSTIVHLKDQKHIYVDSKDITGQNYRLLRMQMIVSCEKVLKRRLVPWEQEALLYPRVCAAVSCREWRQSKLIDCDGCGQISYCADHPDHFPKIHQRWCKSYSLYSKLVCYQQTKGRLEPKMPSKIMIDYKIPDKMNEVLASMYQEKIDMNDIQYAALTQIATAPLTAAYCYQTYTNNSMYTNGTYKKSTCTIHVVGAELQFEADALNKWEVFFLHMNPRVNELRVVLIASDLNPSNLPLELLSKVKVCEDCRLNNRRVIFNFQDKKTYHEYFSSEDYMQPNIVCTFNASINRSSLYNSKDPWPKTINSILKQRVPFLITAYTTNEIHRDLYRIKECAEYKYNVIIEPKNNSFASVRPDRNFISDDEMPLLFKNYCYLLVCGVC